MRSRSPFGRGFEPPLAPVRICPDDPVFSGCPLLSFLILPQKPYDKLRLRQVQNCIIRNLSQKSLVTSQNSLSHFGQNTLEEELSCVTDEVCGPKGTVPHTESVAVCPPGSSSHSQSVQNGVSSSCTADPALPAAGRDCVMCREAHSRMDDRRSAGV